MCTVLCNLCLRLHTLCSLYAPFLNPLPPIIIITMRKSAKCTKGKVWSTHLSPLICSATSISYSKKKMPIKSVASKSDHGRNLIIQTKARFLHQRRAMMMTPFLPFFSSYLYLPVFIPSSSTTLFVSFLMPVPGSPVSHCFESDTLIYLLFPRHSSLPPPSLRSHLRHVSLSGWMKFVAIHLHAHMHLRV